MNKRRQWIFRVIALAVIPCLVLIGLEIILRVVGYGYPTNFFEKVRVGGKEFLVGNENFSRRFFPPELVRSPNAFMLQTPKPAQTYRIFILGESAARGELEPNYAASRYLQVLLQERFPGTRFEVANFGVTAINSHVILPMARDCAQAGGDLWIIYMGNNEMVGPFGAATVFGAKAPPLAMVRANLALQKTRVGQLLVDLSRRLRGKNSNSSWGGMSMFLGNRLPPDDPRKEIVYQNFQRNLNDIVAVGMKSGAKILLNTVVVNLKDCPPFASAEQEYRSGQFQKACDDDALPFRADSRINAEIKAVGQHYAGDKLTLFDAASAFGLCGDETFYEHVHFNFDGNFRLGFAWAQQIEKMLPPEISSARGWPSREICERRLALSDWNRCATLDRVIDRLHRPPLSEQSNNAARLRALHQAAAAFRQSMSPATAQTASSLYQEAIQHAPEDPLLKENYAEFLEAMRNLKQAASQWQWVCELLPYDCVAYYEEGRLLSDMNQWSGAETSLTKAVTLRPRLAQGWFELGNVHLGTAQFDQALQNYERAAQLDPQEATYVAYLGKALAKLNHHAEAMDRYRMALRMDPDLWTAHFALGDELATANQIAEAKNEYAEAVRLRPGLALLHLDLGVMQARLGQLEEALQQFEETLRLDPGNAPAREYLNRVRNWNKGERQ